MKVTRDWIMSHINYGAPNRDQVELLGLRWPINKGWIDKAVGREISPKAAEMFERLQGLRKGARRGLNVQAVKPPPSVPMDALSQEYRAIMADEPKTAKPVICDCKFNIPPWEECPQCVG